MVVVIVIIAIVAAIAIPSLVSFTDLANQTNRMNVARTVFLAAQNQFSELRITQNLKSTLAQNEFGAYYTRNVTTGEYEEVQVQMETFHNVFHDLGDYLPDPEIVDGNQNAVHYIAKDRGDVDLNHPVMQILDPVILDKEILEGAILIEFNVRTGNVLSAFFSDRIDSFVYADDPAQASVLGTRGMGVDGYAFAQQREQGYYGVDSTGRADDALGVHINIYDSSKRPLPDMAQSNTPQPNVLYAEMILPETTLVGADGASIPFDLTLGKDAQQTAVEDIILTDFETVHSLNDALLRTATGDEPILYEFSNGLEQGMRRFIWVIDYVGGDVSNALNSNQRLGIVARYGTRVTLNANENLFAGISGGTVNAVSFTQENPFFYTEFEQMYQMDRHKVQSGRHLSNMRHQLQGNFTQIADIDLQPLDGTPGNVTDITNFAPIGRDAQDQRFTGTFTGSQHVIQNLSINSTMDNQVGLFGYVHRVKVLTYDRASLVGVTLVNPNVLSNQAGASVGSMVGTLNAFASNLSVQFTQASSDVISGAGSTGGIAGSNEGILSDAVFVSPTGIPHVSDVAANGATTAGIVGDNTNGQVERALFLGLAPQYMDTIQRINPIYGSTQEIVPDSTNRNKLYYLSGTGIRPDRVPPTEQAGTAPYNLEPNNGAGVAMDTQGIYRAFVENTDFLSTDWLLNSLTLTDEQVMDINNQVYPYPYARFTTQTAPVYPEWPIVQGTPSSFDTIAYFEKYENNTFGVWFAKDAGTNGTLKDNLTIVEVGYAIIMEDKNMNGRPMVFGAKNADDVSTKWEQAEHKVTVPSFNGDTRSKELSRYLTDVNKIATDVIVIPLKELAAKQNQAKPLRVALGNGSNFNSVVELGGFVQPYFAKGVYAKGVDPENPSEFYVRTPWQMQNISALNVRKENDSKGRTFKQEISIFFNHNGIGVNSADPTEATGPIKSLTNSAVTGTFQGEYNGNEKTAANVTIQAPSKDSIALFEQNGGVIQNLNVNNANITGRNAVAAVVGVNNGQIVQCHVAVSDSGSVSIAGESVVGGIAGTNRYEISNCSVQSAMLASSGSDGLVGGIAGNNSSDKAVIRMGLVDQCSIQATYQSSGAGGITGINGNSSIIEQSGVQFSTIRSISNSGGIAARNAGTVQDVYFVSVNDIQDIPVAVEDAKAESIGGIVGHNNGIVANALYLAPSPKKELNGITKIMPIVGAGTPAAQNADKKETCFYLHGGRYSLNKGLTWLDVPYNREKDVKVECGGLGLITSFLDKDWLEYSYGANFGNWYQPYGYAYPMLSGMVAPQKWPLADSPLRPDQLDRTDWQNVYSPTGRARTVGFVNGEFEMPLTNPNIESEQYPILNSQGKWNQDVPVPPKYRDFNYNANYSHGFYDSSWVPGWSVKPSSVVGSQASYDNPMWAAFSYTMPGTGSTGYPSYNYKGTTDGLFASLYTAQPSMVYQVLPTTSGTELYYSFYHAVYALSWDKFNFCLSGVKNANGQYIYTDGKKVVRPCGTEAGYYPEGRQLSRARDTYTYTGNSIFYGDAQKADFWDPNTNAIRNAYLYDIWIGNYATGEGVGVSVWSNNKYNNNYMNPKIPQKGYASFEDMDRLLEAGISKNIIGYWDVPKVNGQDGVWKRFYGVVTIPEGQNMSEFGFEAYGARFPDSTAGGNYFDNVEFKTQQFVSIDKYIRQNGIDVKFVKPGDELQVEMIAKSWGEVAADRLVIKDQFAPFNEYFELPDLSKVKVYGPDNSDITASCNISMSGDGKQTLTIKLPTSLALRQDQQVRVTFDLKVREKLASLDFSTMLYYFRNQGVVDYQQSEYPAYKNVLRSNGSGEAGNYVQTFIDPIRLDKQASGTSNGVVNGPIRVSISITNTTTVGSELETNGLLTDVIPAGFELVQGSHNFPDRTKYYRNPFDGTLRISVPDVALTADEKKIEYYYELNYVGEAYGVAYTNASADYKYVYEENGDYTDVLLRFNQPTVGIPVKTQPDAFDVSGGDGSTILDLVRNAGLEKKIADNNYDISPTIVLTDAQGNAVPVNVDGNYQVNNEKFTAVLQRSTNQLVFTPRSNADGEYTLYYQVKLTATKEGSPSYVLDSQVTPVTVRVTGSNAVVYYEKYQDNTFGVYAGVGVNVPAPLDDSKTVMESGYGVLSPYNNKVIKTNRIINGKLEIVNNSVPIDATGYYLYVFTTDKTALTDYSLKSVAFGAGADTLIDLAQVYTNFAKCVYPMTQAGITGDFAVRTSQHLESIGALNASAAGTQGKVFVQDRKVEFPAQARTGAVVAGAFKGTYDGKGKEITNLNITSTANDIGLFAQNAGTIKNILLKNATVTGGSNVGGIVGRNGMSGSVSACVISDSSVTATASNAGSVVGWNSDVAADVSSVGVVQSKVQAQSNAGGLIGSNAGSAANGYFVNTIDPANSPVVSTGTAGGMIGSNSGAVSKMLYLSVAPSFTNAGVENIYPIVGAPGSAVVTDCYYLAGEDYRIWNGTEYNPDYGANKPYNKRIALGGGTSMNTEGLTLLDITTWIGWQRVAVPGGYPYPILIDPTDVVGLFAAPVMWVETTGDSTGILGQVEGTPEPSPTASPSASADPTVSPSVEPTTTPSVDPTASPSVEPTTTPSVDPTASPSVEPTATPSADPSPSPTQTPTATPSSQPSGAPTVAPSTPPQPSSSASTTPSATGAVVLSGSAKRG